MHAITNLKQNLYLLNLNPFIPLYTFINCHWNSISRNLWNRERRSNISWDSKTVTKLELIVQTGEDEGKEIKISRQRPLQGAVKVKLTA